MSLSEFLKRYMRDNNFNAKDLAGAIGITHVMVWYIIKNRHPAGVKSMRKIAEYFNLDIREVVKMNDRDKLLWIAKKVG